MDILHTSWEVVKNYYVAQRDKWQPPILYPGHYVNNCAIVKSCCEGGTLTIYSILINDKVIL